MKMVNLVLIGAGNVMASRHVPALLKNRSLFNVLGVIDRDEETARKFAEKFRIPNYAAVEQAADLANIEWMGKSQAVIIGTPPQYHYPFVKECLKLSKHVLVEKPFTRTVDQARELVDLARKKDRILAIKHNFQFSRSFLKLEKLIKNKELGNISSIYCVQLTNQSRRIPDWAEDLPLGLFHDESPHYFYLARRLLGSDIKVKSVFQSKSGIREATPQVLNLNLEARQVPVTIYWNFDSPICEWYFTVFGEKKSASMDLFRDILIVLPNDAPHLGKEVMRTSFLGTLQHWRGILLNGFSYLQNKLYYGFDVAQENFYRAVTENEPAYIDGMSGADGLFIAEIQHRIIAALEQDD